MLAKQHRRMREERFLSTHPGGGPVDTQVTVKAAAREGWCLQALLVWLPAGSIGLGHLVTQDDTFADALGRVLTVLS